VAEVDVDGLAGCAHLGGERRVGRLAAAEVAERSGMVEVAHANHSRLRETRLDAVPGRVLEVEGEPQRRVERAEQELECAFVPCLLERDPDRAEPAAEPAHERLEGVEPA
jgi:hypothetical protein